MLGIAIACFPVLVIALQAGGVFVVTMPSMVEGSKRLCISDLIFLRQLYGALWSFPVFVEVGSFL